MLYQIQYAPKAARAIEGLSRDVQRRIVSRIELLAKNPRPHGTLKLAGQDAYRIRVGDWRVIYAIIDKQLLVFVVDVDHRREVYRNL
ncbi:MAG: type II toxin-antitoxin system RelE/ParE family toxin [Phycisphaerae bacterium]|nr:type II toxin-antitoxin system RelE/ParE family toxin [Phycisphaerae bacterium]